MSLETRKLHKHTFMVLINHKEFFFFIYHLPSLRDFKLNFPWNLGLNFPWKDLERTDHKRKKNESKQLGGLSKFPIHVWSNHIDVKSFGFQFLSVLEEYVTSIPKRNSRVVTTLNCHSSLQTDSPNHRSLFGVTDYSVPGRPVLRCRKEHTRKEYSFYRSLTSPTSISDTPCLQSHLKSLNYLS